MIITKYQFKKRNIIFCIQKNKINKKKRKISQQITLFKLHIYLFVNEHGKYVKFEFRIQKERKKKKTNISNIYNFFFSKRQKLIFKKYIFLKNICITIVCVGCP